MIIVILKKLGGESGRHIIIVGSNPTPARQLAQLVRAPT